ncbi:MAG: hypothetical protein R3270_06180 [Gammaproteobacteria bacterium]|nr:hypothetical protein [Gammaproteobacteria bacterium]
MESQVITDGMLLVIGIGVFLLMLIGIVLTVLEFDGDPDDR